MFNLFYFLGWDLIGCWVYLMDSWTGFDWDGIGVFPSGVVLVSGFVLDYSLDGWGSGYFEAFLWGLDIGLTSSSDSS